MLTNIKENFNRDVVFTHRLILPNTQDCEQLLSQDCLNQLRRMAQEAQPQHDPDNPHYALLMEARCAYPSPKTWAWRRPSQTLRERELCFGLIETIKESLENFENPSAMRVSILNHQDHWEDGSCFERLQGFIDLPMKPEQHLMDLVILGLDFIDPNTINHFIGIEPIKQDVWNGLKTNVCSLGVKPGNPPRRGCP